MPTIGLLVLLTAFVLAIAVRSLVDARGRAAARLESALERADDAAAVGRHEAALR